MCPLDMPVVHTGGQVECIDEIITCNEKLKNMKEKHTLLHYYP
jgi:hypothetical protein